MEILRQNGKFWDEKSYKCHYKFVWNNVFQEIPFIDTKFCKNVSNENWNPIYQTEQVWKLTLFAKLQLMKQRS